MSGRRFVQKAAASHDQHHWAHEVPLVDDAFLFAADGLQQEEGLAGYPFLSGISTKQDDYQ
jgi:hypothetical protein